MDDNGDYGFLTRDQSWACDAILFDKNGKELWSYPGGLLHGVDDSLAGQMEKDGKAKVVVGFDGGGGIVLLDGNGTQFWKKPQANVWHVETLDTNGNGRREILRSNARGQLLVLNANGEILGRYLSSYQIRIFLKQGGVANLRRSIFWFLQKRAGPRAASQFTWLWIPQAK